MERNSILPNWIYGVAFLVFFLITPSEIPEAHSCEVPKAKDLKWPSALSLLSSDVEPCNLVANNWLLSNFSINNYIDALPLPEELSDATRKRIATVCNQDSSFCHHLLSDDDASVHPHHTSSLTKSEPRGMSRIVFDLNALQLALGDNSPTTAVTAMNAGKVNLRAPQFIPMELQFRRYVWSEHIFLQFDQPSVIEKGYVTSAEDLRLLRYNEIINKVSVRYQIDPALLKAMISVESRYNDKAESHRGAKGLMQLMPRTAAELGVTDILDPEQNIDAGARYFKWLLKRVKGQRDLALAAYNAGLQRVWDYRGIPPFAETRAYIMKVNRYYDKYKQRSQKS